MHELTEKVVTGCTLTDYLWRCARSMDPFAHIKDFSLDAQLPAKMPPIPAPTTEMILKHAARIIELEEMSDAKKAELAAEALAAEQQAIADTNAATAPVRNILRQKLEEVMAWQPPTKEHEPLRSFAASQLERHLNAVPEHSAPDPEDYAPETWHARELLITRNRLTVLQEAQFNIRLTNRHNQEWYATLLEALPPPPDQIAVEATDVPATEDWKPDSKPL